MFLRSIRFKIMLWYMLLLTITLLSFSSMLYGGFTKMLYNSLDDLLCFRSEGIANSTSAYWAAKAVEIRHDPQSLADFAKNATGWVEEKRKDPELMSVFVQILNSKGEKIVSSKNMPRLQPIDEHTFRDILSGEEDFDTVKGETYEGKKMKFRVYSKPIVEGGEVEYIVQVAGPVSLLSLATKNLILVLFVIIPLTVLLAGIPGVLLAQLTLRPVDKMIDTIKQTTAENLKLKIHMPDTKDEIKRLADTFNEMIERLDRSFSSQQSFIQDISCELKTPLAALKEKFAVALDGKDPAVDHSALLRHGIEHMNKFAHVIEELETLASFDNDRIALEIRKVNLSQLLEKVVDCVKQAAEAKGIVISSFLKDKVNMDGDEKQLRILFENILDNAVKFTNRKGKITVSLHKNAKNATVTISDTGIGLDDSEISYIFDRFYQVNKSRVSSGSFGLGLSIAKSVVEMHKGSIGVESKLGSGSVFKVTLPLSFRG